MLLTHMPPCRWGTLHTSRHSSRSRWAGNIAGLGRGKRRGQLPGTRAHPSPHRLSNGVAPGSPCVNPKGLQCPAQEAGMRGGRSRQVQQAGSEWGRGPETPPGKQWREPRGPWARPQTLHPHPVFTGEPGWAGAPIQPPGLSCCSNTFCEGAVLGGGHTWLPRSWENATAARPAAPPANKAPAAEESEQPIVVPGPPPGAPGLHPGDLAPPPRTPNTCSLRHLRGCAPCAPREDEDAPFQKESDPTSEKRVIHPAPPSHPPGCVNQAPRGDGDGEPCLLEAGGNSLLQLLGRLLPRDSRGPPPRAGEK